MSARLLATLTLLAASAAASPPVASLAVGAPRETGSPRGPEEPRPLPERGRPFARQADLSVAHDGLVMLVLPPEVLAETQPDLSDLRIIDRSGREVPFFVEASAPPAPPAEPLVAPVVRAVAREMRTPEGETPSVMERYELSWPDAAGASVARRPERVALRIASSLPRFVRVARVEVKASDGSRSRLVADAPLFSVQGAARTQIELPRFEGTLVLTLEGHEAGYLEPTFSFQSLPAAHQPAATARVPLAMLSEESRDGTTALELARPLGLVPGALQLATDTAAFSRRAKAFDVLPAGAHVELGHGTLVRLETLAGAEALELPLRAAARGERLRIEIEDHDSPPLAKLGVHALVKQPALVFALESHGDGEPDGALYFGGGEAFRPVYDLASLQELVSDPVSLKRVLAELRASDVRLGPLRDNPSFAPSAPLEFARQPGAPLELARFTHRRSLAIAPSANGLARLRLAPEDVAIARPDLADLRVAGSDGVQWPFLLAPGAAREWRFVAISAPTSLQRRSRYDVTLPWGPVAADALELETDAPFFDRAYRLTMRGADGAERVVASGRLDRDPDRPRPVRIGLAGERVGALELEIDDGDDAPLRFTHATLRVVLPELFVTAPPGAYWLVLGARDAEPPRYELERVRDIVLAVRSTSIQAGPLEGNPAFSPARELTSGVRGRTLLVWIALATAVAALATLTLRAARREGGAPSAP